MVDEDEEKGGSRGAVTIATGGELRTTTTLCLRGSGAARAGRGGGLPRTGAALLAGCCCRCKLLRMRAAAASLTSTAA